MTCLSKADPESLLDCSDAFFKCEAKWLLQAGAKHELQMLLCLAMLTLPT